jgi:hypothetical protein
MTVTVVETVDKTGHYAAGYAVVCGLASSALCGALWLSRHTVKTSVECGAHAS